MALSHLWNADRPWHEGIPSVDACPPAERAILVRQFEAGLNSVPTSSVGRLFDAVSSLVGVRHEITYEGQAAIELETLAATEDSRSYRFAIDRTSRPWVIECSGVIRQLMEDRASIAERSGAFHLGLSRMIVEAATALRADRGVEVIGLSGGVFQNSLLLYHALQGLTEAGFRVLTHSKVPPNDGGLALGQAVLARGG